MLNEGKTTGGYKRADDILNAITETPAKVFKPTLHVFYRDVLVHQKTGWADNKVWKSCWRKHC